MAAALSSRPGLPELTMIASLLSRVLVFALVLTALSGCGPARNEFAPACPSPIFPKDTADIAVYRPNSGGRDLTDLMFAGRMMKISGECKLGSDKGTLRTTVTFVVEVSRGPALPGASVEAPVYLAVVAGDRILDKRIFALRGQFPSNVDRLMLSSGELDMALPVSSARSGAAYYVVAGFQLTPEQLAAARARSAR